MRLSAATTAGFDRFEKLVSQVSVTTAVWLTGAAFTAIFVLVGVVLYASRLDVHDATWTASTNLVATLGQRIGREIELLDMSLLDLRDAAQRDDVASLSGPLRQALMFDRAASAEGFGSLLLLDASGRLVAEAGVTVPPALDLSAEPFFAVHRTGDVGLYVSHPFVSVVDGEASIALSRRVMRAGVFAGAAVATIKLSYFHNLFSSIDLGPSDALGLFMEDGSPVMRRPARPMPPAALERVRRDFGMHPGTRGNFESIGVQGMPERQVFFERLGSHPLVQLLGRGVDEIYAPWWRRAVATAVALFVIGTVILLLITVLWAELRRREAAEAALSILATTDKLTGLANRRQFDEMVERAWSRARANGTPLALLLIDIDHFKALNDKIGHLGGDAVLAAVGGCLARVPIGPGGIAARFGGEEFALVLPDTGLGEASAVAEAVRCAIVALAQPHPYGGRLTVSVGVAVQTPGPTQRSAQLVALADAALYDAKAAGRDRVAVAACPIARAA